MTNDPTPRSTRSLNAPRVTVVRFRERVVDAVAAICLVGGSGLFLFARQSLTSLANGKYLIPKGTSYVAHVDTHALQSTIGLWLAAAGLALAIASAMSHSRARRAGGRRRLASADAR